MKSKNLHKLALMYWEETRKSSMIKSSFSSSEVTLTLGSSAGIIEWVLSNDEYFEMLRLVSSIEQTQK